MIQTNHKKPRGRPRKRPHPAIDLFGQVPVTWEEVFLWLEAVPGIARDSPRAAQYVRDWNVPEKVRQAKLEGSFEAAVSRPSDAPRWGQFAALLDAARRG